MKVEAALARTEEAVAGMIKKLQDAFAGIQDQLPDVVQSAVAAQIDKFLEQPIASLLGSSMDSDGPVAEPATHPAEPLARKQDALMKKAFRFR